MDGTSDLLMDFDVFLSHNSKDKPQVLELGRALRSRGLEVWLDEWELAPGRPWQDGLAEILETARSAAVLVGRAGIGPWEDLEMKVCLSEFVERKMPVVPVLLPGCPEEPKIPRFLGQLRWVDLRRGVTEEGLDLLVWGITGEKPGAGVTQSTFWNIPAPSPFFIGRENILDELHAALLREPDHDRARLQVLSGLGGIGKTETALGYARRFRSRYQAGFWVVAEAEEQLKAGVVEVASLLDLPEKDVRDQDKIVQAVLNWLETHSDWLLILDNVDRPDGLKRFIPANPRGHVLLTSRASVFDGLGILRPVKLGGLPAQQALAFLLKRSARETADAAERQAAVETAEELGHLPLALEQAGAYLVEQKTGFRAFLDSYKRRRLELLNRARPRAGKDLTSIAATWTLNFREVEANDRASAEILRASAFLSPESIPLLLFEEGAPELGPILTEDLSDARDDLLILHEALAPLERYSLIEREIGSTSFSIHRMVQEVLRDEMNPPTRRLWAERVLRSLYRIFPEPRPEDWVLCQALLPHAKKAVELVDAFDFEFEEVGQLLEEAGRYSFDRGNFGEAEPLARRGFDIQSKLLGPGHPRVTRGAENLASIYRSLGDYAEAVPFCRRVLSHRETTLGPDHPEVAGSLNDLALVLKDLGRYDQAERLHQRALQIREEVLGAAHPDLAQSLDNLAVVYRHQNRHREAEPLHQRALVIREAAQGPEHLDLAATLTHLALLYLEEGRYEEAEPLYQEALRVRTNALGSEHLKTAASLTNLAELHRLRGDLPKALSLHRMALTIHENNRGVQHPLVAESLNNLARIYFDQGRYEEAEPLYRRALQIYEEALGPEHPHVYIVRDNLRQLARFSDGEFSP